MERLARFVLRHRLLVSLGWLVLLLGGAACAGQLGSRLSFDFSLPGQPGYEAEERLVAQYGTSSFDTLLPVLTAPQGSTIYPATGRSRRRVPGPADRAAAGPDRRPR